MKAAFYTLGCKVNQYETQTMVELLKNNGFDIVDVEDSPDVFIVNSCTVTDESDRKTRQNLRKYRRLFPHAVLVLTGCMPQAFPDVAEKLPEADIIIGNKNHGDLTEAIREFYNTHSQIVKIDPHNKGDSFKSMNISAFQEHTRAFLKIEDGCNQFCSYCIIPTARGRVRSKDLKDITAEAKKLSAAGFKEIVLVGINLSAYGSDIASDICGVVEACEKLEGIERIRLGSLEADLLTKEQIERLSLSKKLCPHFHLSLQSGCDKTLKRMNRKYDSGSYFEIVEAIRERFLNPSITTDIMVGFPGETEDEFLESLSFVDRVKFAKAHVFAYSQRPGTKAAEFGNQVSRSEKSRRSKIMIEHTKYEQNAFLSSQIGMICPILFERTVNGYAVGYSPNYSEVRVKTGLDCNGRVFDVLITGAGQNACYCEGVLR